MRGVALAIGIALAGLSSPRLNKKTAKALGLTLPPSLLSRADDVIE